MNDTVIRKETLKIKYEIDEILQEQIRQRQQQEQQILEEAERLMADPVILDRIRDTLVEWIERLNLAQDARNIPFIQTAFQRLEQQGVEIPENIQWRTEEGQIVTLTFEMEMDEDEPHPPSPQNESQPRP